MDINCEPELLEEIRRKLAAFGSHRGDLIPMLQTIQDLAAYLPPDAIQWVATRLGIPSCEVFGVATFYNQFRFHPPGRNPVRVCLGTACHVKGGEIILENFERKLEIKTGETTADREYSLERVACVGCCALAPVALVGDATHGHMAPSKVEGLITRIEVEKEIAQRKKEAGDIDEPASSE
jgi:NADH-quinone oxidoreductase subunit E